MGILQIIGIIVILIILIIAFVVYNVTNAISYIASQPQVVAESKKVDNVLEIPPDYMANVGYIPPAIKSIADATPAGKDLAYYRMQSFTPSPTPAVFPKSSMIYDQSTKLTTVDSVVSPGFAMIGNGAIRSNKDGLTNISITMVSTLLCNVNIPVAYNIIRASSDAARNGVIKTIPRRYSKAMSTVVIDLTTDIKKNESIGIHVYSGVAYYGAYNSHALMITEL